MGSDRDRERGIDVAAGLRAGDTLTVGVRLRIVLDVLEALADAPVEIAPRTSASRLGLDRVRIDDEGLATIEGDGDASGLGELVWEILAAQPLQSTRPLFLDSVVDDLPHALVELVDTTCSGGGARTSEDLAARVEAAARGVVDTHDDVRRSVRGWPRAAARSAAPAATEPSPAEARAPEPPKPEAAPTQPAAPTPPEPQALGARAPATTPPTAVVVPAPKPIAAAPKRAPATTTPPRLASPATRAAAPSMAKPTPDAAAKSTALPRPRREAAKTPAREPELRASSKESREAAIRAKLAELRATGVNVNFYEASSAPAPSRPSRERPPPVGRRIEALRAGRAPATPEPAPAPAPAPSPPPAPAPPAPEVVEEQPACLKDVELPRTSRSSAPALVAASRPHGAGTGRRDSNPETRRVRAATFAALAGAIVGVGVMVTFAVSSRSAPRPPDLSRIPTIAAPAPTSDRPRVVPPADRAESVASPPADPPPAAAAPAKQAAPPATSARRPSTKRPPSRYGFLPSRL